MPFIWIEDWKRGGIGRLWGMTGLRGESNRRDRYLTRLKKVIENIESCGKVFLLLGSGMIMILEWTIQGKITRIKM
jgi:hypothetical protein